MKAERFLELCENDFPMYLIDDDPYNQFGAMDPTQMLHDKLNSKENGNFVDDFISRHFFKQFIRIKDCVVDYQKLINSLKNKPSLTKLVKLKSKSFEKIETI